MSVGVLDPTEALVPLSGDVYVAPVGAPLPTLVRTPLHTSFYRLGLVTDEGVKLAWMPEIDEHGAWQDPAPIRREMAQQRIALTFDIVQWTATNLVFALGGNGAVVEYAPNHWRYYFPGDDATVDERSLVFDWEDGDKLFRLVWIRGTVLGGLTTDFRRGAMAVLPIGFDVLAVTAGGSPGFLYLSSDPTVGPPPPPPPPGTPLFGDGDFGDGDFGG